MKIKISAALLIVFGIFVLLYPTISEKYYESQQQKIASDWLTSMANISTGNEDVEPKALVNDNENNTEEAESDETAEDRKDSSLSSYNPNAEGILMIEKINLRQPILRGATTNHLNISVASVENTGKAGEVGNYAVAGHRNRTYGRNFNRLDEMKKGDKIQVNNGEEQFEYTVTEKLYVKPEEVWVLEPNGKDKEITLITCHPMVNPTHRIIVKGKIMEEPKTETSSL
ncbi:class D sortase [Paenibacillus faecalis]|uniref:class D sortase n=1 Tax=Paenibacillus faecalis TaxID=2079532 RepID=UPI000D109407|nr:class D sortase [Paenibacillus faecalis]